MRNAHSVLIGLSTIPSLKDPTNQNLLRILDLGTRPTILDAIKAVAREAARQNLDIKTFFREQDSAKIAEVEGRISQQFPDIFEHPSLSNTIRKNRMEIIMAYAQRAFNFARHQARGKHNGSHESLEKRPPKRREKRSQRSSSPSISTTPRLGGTVNRTPSTRARRSSTRINNLSLTRQRNSFTTTGTQTPARVHGPASSRSPQTCPPSFAPSISTNMNTSSFGASMLHRSQARPPRSSRTTMSSQYYSPVSSTARTSASSSSRSSPQLVKPPEYRIDEVANFLHSCVPNMSYLLNTFIEFGCRNGEFLLAVAKWPDGEIEELLKRMIDRTPPTEVSGMLPEMELWILKKHFKSIADDPRAMEIA